MKASIGIAAIPAVMEITERSAQMTRPWEQSLGRDTARARQCS